MENTANNTIDNPVRPSVLANILEQLKIVIIIYLLVGVLHRVSLGSGVTDLLKAAGISFVMVALAIILKNVVKRPNLPGFAWATLVSFLLTLPISPLADFIIQGMAAFSFGLVGLPLLAFAGIAVGEQLEVFKKLSWKIVIISFIVMASTYFGSAAISNLVLSIRGLV